MWKNTAITRRLGLQVPIIQGPFGGGLSTVPLVAGVSEAGGLGSYGAHLLAPEQIREIASEIRCVTARPFALNLWVSSHDSGAGEMDAIRFAESREIFSPIYEELGITIPTSYRPETIDFAAQAAAVIEARPAVFSFVFGIPAPEILEACRRAGITTVGAATTAAEAVAIEGAGVDLVLATGCEAGGHRPSFLRPAEESLVGTLALVPQIVDRVKIPVIAAGGIADARGAAAAFALGAGAVQLGTAFLACEESGASPIHRACLFGEHAAVTRLSRAFTGRLARFITNRALEEIEARQGAALPYPLQGWFTGFIKAAAAMQERGEFMALYAGQGAPLLKHRRARDLMAALCADLDALY